MIKSKKCIVKAKSGTSFDRETSRSSGITLAQISFGILMFEGRSVREECDQQPDNGDEPPKGAVAFYVVPIKHQPYGELLAEYQDCEKEEDESDCIV